MNRPGPQLALLLLGGYRQLVEAATDELARRGHHDVRPSHHYAMRAIDDGADSASELGRRLGVSKQAALKTVAVLVERGWVVREDDPTDARRMRLRVTDLGHDVTATGEQVFDDLRRGWEEEIGADELAALEAQLTRLVGDAAVRPEAPGWAGGA